MRISLIDRASQWGVGAACIIGLAACGTPDPPASVPSGTVVSQPTAVFVDAPTAEPATSTATPPAPVTNSPTATTQETIMPDQKPTQPSNPARPTLQLAATLVPEAVAPADPPTNMPLPAATPAPATAPVEVAKADLARRRSVAPETIRVVEVRDVIWPDRGLGCPQPGMAYKQVPVDGLLIRLESGGELFEYHSGGGKAPFLCEHPSGGDKATPVSGGEGQ